MRMTQEELRRAAGLEPGWEVIWTGAGPPTFVLHLCERLYSLCGTYEGAWARLPYQPRITPRIEAATCTRCRAAWIRSAAPAPAAPARRPEYV